MTILKSGLFLGLLPRSKIAAIFIPNSFAEWYDFRVHRTLGMDDKKIIRSAGIIGGFTLVSRILGLVRDVLMAGLFGTSMAMGGFVIAFMIPNLSRRLFGEGALSAAFVPIFVDTRQNDGEEAAWLLARRVISMVAVVLSVLVGLGIVLASVLLHHAQPGTMSHLIWTLLRIMLPYMTFICLVALCMGILNAYHHFAVPAATPTVLNMVWIATLLFLCPHFGETRVDKIHLVAWAVLLAGCLQLVVQLPMLRKHGYRFGLDFSWNDPNVQRVLVLMGPAALGLAISQVNVVIDKALAAWVAPWAPACLFYSERLIYFPLGIFATALSTVLLPVFSGQSVGKDMERYRETIAQSLRNLLFIMVPASLGLFVLAEPIIAMTLQWGAFTEQSAQLTALSLQAYAPGLIVFSLGKVFVPAFYGMHDTRTPVLVGVGVVGLNLVLNLVAVWLWPAGTKHAGLAFASVLSSGAGALVLARLLHRRVGSLDWSIILNSLFRCFILSLGMACVAFFVHRHLVVLLSETTLNMKVCQIGSVGGGIILAVSFYMCASGLARAPELKMIMAALARRSSS